MTLTCAAESCVYNNCGACYAGKIIVAGLNARKSSSTNCATYSEEGNGLSNLSSNTFTTSSDIDCQAKNCHYNENGTCVAESVNIDNKRAHCNTFIRRNY